MASQCEKALSTKKIQKKVFYGFFKKIDIFWSLIN